MLSIFYPQSYNPDKVNILKILNDNYIIENRVEQKEVIKDETILVTKLKKLIPDVVIKETKRSK